MEPFNDAGDVHKAQKRNVELVIAGGHTAKDVHALEKVVSDPAGPARTPSRRKLCGTRWNTINVRATHDR